MPPVLPGELPDIPEEVLIASICRESFKDFVKHFITVVIQDQVHWNWHMDVLCDELQYVAERVFKNLPVEHNLLINIPPGTTKSTIISVLFPAWVWTRMPHARIIGTSYSGSLALELSAKNRDVVQSEKYRACFPEVVIRDDQNNKGDFVTTRGGKRVAVGSKGMVTGKHAHFIIIDDPLDPTRALSQAEILTINYWIKHTLSSRVTNKLVSVKVMVMQRVHVDDPSAEMAQQPKTRWIRLPATTEFGVLPKEYIDNYKDGLLDPVRLPRSFIDEMLAPGGQGETYVACQYGQCLVAGTLIATLRGMVPIESVVVGDKVFTRQGWKTVLWSGVTKVTRDLYRARFQNGRSITGTPDHRVYQYYGQWTRLDSLSGRDYSISLTPETYREIESWAGQEQKEPKRSFSTELLTFVSGGRLISATDAKTGIDSTVTFGDSTEGKSPRVVTFITGTKTLATTGLTTLNASRSPNITSATRNDSRRRNIATTSLQKSYLWLGRKLRRLKDEIVSAGKERRAWSGCGPRPNTGSTPAPTAGESSSPAIRGSGPFVTVLDNARKSVAVPVYDLTVEDAEEFFANGILVHNSPYPLGGNLFKTSRLRWGILPPPDQFKSVVRAWDKAGTDPKLRGVNAQLSRGPAYTVGTLMGIDKFDRVWLIDVIRQRLDSFIREQLIIATARRDRLKYGRGCKVAIEQEPGSSGLETAQATARRLMGYQVVLSAASGTKEVRAAEFSVCVNGGNCYIPHTFRDGNRWVGWAKDWVEEAVSWPNSSYLDQIDSASLGYNTLAKPKVRVGGLKKTKKFHDTLKDR